MNQKWRNIISIKISPKPTDFFTWRHGHYVLNCDKAGTEQANTNLHWIFPPFANKGENSTVLLRFASRDVQARSPDRQLQPAALPGRTALVRLRKGGRKDHSNGGLVDFVCPLPPPNHACYVRITLALYASHRSCELKFGCSK